MITKLSRNRALFIVLLPFFAGFTLGHASFASAQQCGSSCGPTCSLVCDSFGHPQFCYCPAQDCSRVCTASTSCDTACSTSTNRTTCGAYGVGSCINTDVDGDGVPNNKDNCKNVANPGQQDCDADGVGDACDSVNAKYVPDNSTWHLCRLSAANVWPGTSFDLDLSALILYKDVSRCNAPARWFREPAGGVTCWDDDYPQSDDGVISCCKDELWLSANQCRSLYWSPSC